MKKKKFLPILSIIIFSIVLVNFPLGSTFAFDLENSSKIGESSCFEYLEPNQPELELNQPEYTNINLNNESMSFFVFIEINGSKLLDVMLSSYNSMDLNQYCADDPSYNSILASAISRNRILGWRIGTSEKVISNLLDIKDEDPDFSPGDMMDNDTPEPSVKVVGITGALVTFDTAGKGTLNEWTNNTILVPANSSSDSHPDDQTSWGKLNEIAPHATPKNSNEVFLGWFLDEDQSNNSRPINSEYGQVTRDCTVYAHYTTNAYTITFDTMGKGVLNGPPTLSANTSTLWSDIINGAPSVNTTNIDEKFIGWFFDKDPNNNNNPLDSKTDRVDNNYTLYAHYEPITYTITFDTVGKGTLNGSENIGATPSTQWSTIISNAPGVNPTNNNEYFIGWFFSDETELVNKSGNVDGNYTLYAKYNHIYSDGTLTIQYHDISKIMVVYEVDEIDRYPNMTWSKHLSVLNPENMIPVDCIFLGYYSEKTNTPLPENDLRYNNSLVGNTGQIFGLYKFEQKQTNKIPVLIQADSKEKYKGEEDPELSAIISLDMDLFNPDLFSMSIEEINKLIDENSKSFFNLSRDKGESVGEYTIRVNIIEEESKDMFTFRTIDSIFTILDVKNPIVPPESSSKPKDTSKPNVYYNRPTMTNKDKICYIPPHTNCNSKDESCVLESVPTPDTENICIVEPVVTNPSTGDNRTTLIWAIAFFVGSIVVLFISKSKK